MPVGPSGGSIVEILRRSVGVIIPGPTQAGVAGTGTAAITFTAIAASWTTTDITVDVYAELQLDLTITTNTTSIKYVVNRKGADGIYYPIATSATHTDAGPHSVSLSLGSGTCQGSGGLGIPDTATGNTNWTAPYPFGDLIQIVLTPVGAFTGTLSLKGK